MTVKVLTSTREIEEPIKLLNSALNLVTKLKENNNRQLELIVIDYAVIRINLDICNYDYFILLCDNGDVYKITSKSFWKDFKHLPGKLGTPIKCFFRENKKNPNYPCLACEHVIVKIPVETARLF